jgi:flavin-dependent dehydrogenase
VRYDVVILGGGPAGTATALSLMRLRSSLRVLVIEASRYDQWRVGETLSPGCQTILQGLGCWDRFRGERVVESYGTCSAWGSKRPYDNEFLFSLHGSGWHVDRRRFDAMLSLCAGTAGAEVWSDARLADSEWRGDRGWRLTLRAPDRLLEVEAQFVVDATGRSASFAAQRGARRVAADRLIGAFVRFHFPAGGAPRDARTLVEAQEDGWWYSALTPDSCVVVAWMSDADLVRERRMHVAANWLEHLRQCSLTLARVEQGVPELPPRVWAAQSQRLTPTSGPGWVATGDAATTLDPLSSQGILKALRSGKLASFVVLDCLAGRSSAQSRYDALLARDHKHYCAIKAWFYSLEQRWPGSPFWSRRHLAVV